MTRSRTSGGLSTTTSAPNPLTSSAMRSSSVYGTSSTLHSPAFPLSELASVTEVARRRSELPRPSRTRTVAVRGFSSPTWVRTCGGLFDFLSGRRPRAPEAVQAMGLEWAWRAAQEPRRLGWRYATTNVNAILAMARETPRRPRV